MIYCSTLFFIFQKWIIVMHTCPQFNGLGVVWEFMDPLTSMEIYISSLCVLIILPIHYYWKIRLSKILEDIYIFDIPLQLWMIRIYTVIFWYNNHIHQFIHGVMMFWCLQFVIITIKLVLYYSIFGVSVILSITTIGNKNFDCAKPGFRVICDQRIVPWIFLGYLISPILLC